MNQFPMVRILTHYSKRDATTDSSKDTASFIFASQSLGSPVTNLATR